MKIKLILAVLVLLLPFMGNSFSQVTDKGGNVYKTVTVDNQEWVSNYNGPGNGDDYSSCITADVNGNIYISGENLGIGSGNNIVTIKYNSSGTQIWERTYNGNSNSRDAAYSITTTESGNIYITGVVNNSYCIILKYNPIGVLEWERILNNLSLGLCIKTDIYENVYVAGYSSDNGTGPDFLTVKYDSSGVLMWARTYNGPGNDLDIAIGVGVDNYGNIYTGGYSYSGNNYLTTDYAVVKYNSSGNQQWVMRYDGPGNSLDEVYAFTVDSSGNSYITGNCRNINNSDYTTIKYNSSGIQEWVSFYNGVNDYYDGARAICVDLNGNVIVTGFSSVSSGNDNFDYATVKYNSSGAQQWIQRYNGTANQTDMATVVVSDNNNNIFVSGKSWTGTKYEFTTVKYNSLGVQQWVQKLGGTNNSGDGHVNGIALDPSDNIYVTGPLDYTGQGKNYTTVKYSQLVSGNNISNDIPEKYKLSQNYPNPFNPTAVIRYSIPKQSIVKLVVFDALGKEIQTLVNEYQQAGTYETIFNGAALTSGVYYYKLAAGDFISTRKMLLVK